MNCSDIQERLARGIALTPDERAHATGCDGCSKVAETYALLDVSVDPRHLGPPENFAERVMSAIGREATEKVPWFERPWAPVLLVNAALVISAFNVARFIAAVFVPSIGIAGAP